ncbi:sugar kinase [uncultured Victivallis sp.]|uniref:sugar kinase n=1 Tax=uncultured Victivallis sp. TaxID=354118 RepID=UPI0025F1771F|nr:sugar kinase [uncultured Victivallis sp.]
MQKIVIAGFGEVMLRLCPPGKKRFAQSLPGALDATYGGGEANVCASLAMLGSESRYLTALPENPVSLAFAAELRGLGVDVSHITWNTRGRMGVYYAEHGAAQRGSNVIYDREGSTISLLAPEEYDFDAMLEGVNHLHLTGITPSLSENAYRSTLTLARKAAERGVAISCDLNFRKKLWKWRPGTEPRALAEECMGNLVPLVDWIICNEEDASDVFGIRAEATEIEAGKLNVDGYRAVAEQLLTRFPKASKVAITLRESISADHNNWGAMLFDRNAGAFFAPVDARGHYSPYEIRNIVDRFGGGDSFGAGLIHALYSEEFSGPQQAIRFAVAASCLKHTISGDYNYSSRAEVVSLMNGSGSGRVAR